MESSSSDSHVCVRVRPMPSLDSGETPPSVLHADRIDRSKIRFNEGNVVRSTCSAAFSYARVYDHLSTNDMIFRESLVPRLSDVLDGKNMSVFAYGATGSGKTHTMLGTGDTGLVFRVANFLLDSVARKRQQLAANSHVAMQVTFIEVYNEVAYDLLAPDRTQLKVLILDKPRRCTFDKLTSVGIESIESFQAIVARGMNRRVKGETSRNKESSRSHAILEMKLIASEEVGPGLPPAVTESVIKFVDLAGSERAATVSDEQSRRTEGVSINKGLLAVNKLLQTTASGKKFVSYRDSVLTKVLIGCIGGNCNTVLFAMVSGEVRDAATTLNTLHYANMAQKIESNAQSNKRIGVVSSEESARVIKALMEKVERLEQKLREAAIQPHPQAAPPAVEQQGGSHLCTGCGGCSVGDGSGSGRGSRPDDARQLQREVEKEQLRSELRKGFNMMESLFERKKNCDRVKELELRLRLRVESVLVAKDIERHPAAHVGADSHSHSTRVANALQTVQELRRSLGGLEKPRAKLESQMIQVKAAIAKRWQDASVQVRGELEPEYKYMKERMLCLQSERRALVHQLEADIQRQRHREKDIAVECFSRGWEAAVALDGGKTITWHQVGLAWALASNDEDYIDLDSFQQQLLRDNSGVTGVGQQMCAAVATRKRDRASYGHAGEMTPAARTPLGPRPSNSPSSFRSPTSGHSAKRRNGPSSAGAVAQKLTFADDAQLMCAAGPTQRPVVKTIPVPTTASGPPPLAAAPFARSQSAGSALQRTASYSRPTATTKQRQQQQRSAGAGFRF